MTVSWVFGVANEGGVETVTSITFSTKHVLDWLNDADTKAPYHRVRFDPQKGRIILYLPGKYDFWELRVE